ncbi:MAG TPA: adenylate/guanylate cyclase domain-containing protein [Stellaceae bacterium]|nr:adenylate/guanylate cyclase domain-containing protein [Stellaceae bacterium]
MAPERVERKLAAILAGDIAGYSRLTGADEEGTICRLRALRAKLIDPAIEINRGHIVKTTGDGILIEFASVVDAVRCSLEVQRGMAVRNADFMPEKRIEFRIGIHLGDVVVQPDGDLLGDGVNIAARLEGIAASGGICISEDAYRQVRDRLKEEFTDLGDKELKNVARPIRVYSVKTGSGAAVSSPDAFAPEKSGPRRLSIVVLPFANLGGDPEQEYFVDGVTESLTTDLSRMSGAFVIARSTAFTYKGKAVDVKQIGRELGVRYLLEGSVQRGGDRIRINVQLVDAESGAHLWAERFDRDRVDLFEMQDEIVAHLARTLDAELTAAEARRAERSHSADPDALDLTFRGWAAYNRGHSLGDLLEAARFFDQALMLDQQNVGALAGLALAKLSPYSGIHTKEERAIHFGAAEAAAAKAVALAPNNASAHRALGWAYTLTDRAALGIAQFERAIALDRNHAPAYGGIGWAKILLGRAEEAEDHIACALRLSPRDRLAYQWYHFVGTANLCLGRYDEAEIWLRRAIEVDMTYPQAQFALAVALAQQGKLASAQAAAKQGLALAPASTVRRFRDGVPSNHPTFLAQRERFYEGLCKAGVPEG